MLGSCVILLSGGPDSALLLQRHALTCKAAVFIDYGQPARIRESVAAQSLAKHFGVRLVTFGIDGLGKRHEVQSMGAPGSPSVVPARNALLISLAVTTALRLDAKTVLIGCCQDDMADYIDCRPGFVMAVSRMFGRLGVSVMAPLVYTSKASIMGELNNDARAMAVSCYRAAGPCGECNACISRTGG